MSFSRELQPEKGHLNCRRSPILLLLRRLLVFCWSTRESFKLARPRRGLPSRLSVRPTQDRLSKSASTGREDRQLLQGAWERLQWSIFSLLPTSSRCDCIVTCFHSASLLLFVFRFLLTLFLFITKKFVRFCAMKLL